MSYTTPYRTSTTIRHNRRGYNTLATARPYDLINELDRGERLISSVLDATSVLEAAAYRLTRATGMIVTEATIDEAARILVRYH